MSVNQTTPMDIDIPNKSMEVDTFSSLDYQSPRVIWFVNNNSGNKFPCNLERAKISEHVQNVLELEDVDEIPLSINFETEVPKRIKRSLQILNVGDEKWRKMPDKKMFSDNGDQAILDLIDYMNLCNGTAIAMKKDGEIVRETSWNILANESPEEWFKTSGNERVWEALKWIHKIHVDGDHNTKSPRLSAFKMISSYMSVKYVQDIIMLYYYFVNIQFECGWTEKYENASDDAKTKSSYSPFFPIPNKNVDELKELYTRKEKIDVKFADGKERFKRVTYFQPGCISWAFLDPRYTANESIDPVEWFNRYVDSGCFANPDIPEDEDGINEWIEKYTHDDVTVKLYCEPQPSPKV